MRRAQEAFSAGNLMGAAQMLRPLLQAQGANPGFLYLLATVEGELGQWGEAERLIRQGLKAAPNHRPLLTRLARAHVARGDLEGAHEAIDRAIALDETESRAVSVKAELLLIAGRAHEARELLLGAIETRRPVFPLAVILAESAMATGEHAEALSIALPLRDDPSLHPMARRSLLFRLARLHERLGQADEAFAAACDANALRPSRFDPDAYDRSIDRMIEAWTDDDGPNSGELNDRMVFIVSMPRSGTSLLEQMLDRHPKIRGVGELPFFRAAMGRLGLSDNKEFAHAHYTDRFTPELLKKLAREYLKRSGAVADGPVVIDKDPTNFEHLGLISRMLPRCRVIHCVRDPMDCCASCFFQEFTGVLPYAGDLAHLGRAYRAQERLMEHWKRTLPIPIHTVRYESLASNTEPTIRGVCEFLGLEFDEACCSPQHNQRVVFTPSNQQVREAVNTRSVGRAERIREHLGPLREAMGLGD